MKSAKLFIISFITSIALSGCATYGSGVQKALMAVESGDLTAASSYLQESLSPEGKDQLLYFLELGVVKHLEGQYEESNALFEQAANIADKLQTTSLSNSFLGLMSNPRNTTYSGADHERVYIYYYKALNYLAIASLLPPGNARLDATEGARIESRRLLVRLKALRADKGSYKNERDSEQSTFAGLMDVFSVVTGNLVDEDKLTYRDDALAHYLTGLSFELNDEYDNARISYQAAAESYESGYAEQFRLGPAIAEQAWFDTLRMMQASGAYRNEWPALAAKKLLPARVAELSNVQDKAQIVIIEDKGRVPEKKELNLSLSINPQLRSLEIEPYLFEFRGDKIAWFQMMYADKGVYGLVADYLNATRNNELNFFNKTFFLGPLYTEAEKLGLTKAIGQSLRVAVPYYAIPKPLKTSQVEIRNATTGKVQRTSLNSAASPQQIAVQEQMKRAGEDIRSSLARSALKSLATSSITSNDSTGILAFAGKLTAQLTDAAETRSWLLLPAEIHLQRLFLDPGEYTLAIESGSVIKTSGNISQSFNLQKNDIQIWQVRSFGDRAVSDSQDTNTAAPTEIETESTDQKTSI